MNGRGRTRGQTRGGRWVIGPALAVALLTGCTGTSSSTGPETATAAPLASPTGASSAAFAPSATPLSTSTWSPTPTPDAGASPTAAPSPSPTALIGVGGCPTPPVDVATTRDLVHAGKAVKCFGTTPITFRAYVPTTDGLGGVSGSKMTPAWLADDWMGVILQPMPLAEQDQNAWLVVRVPPSLGRCSITDEAAPTCPFGPHLDGYVMVTGHFDDPAAATCKSAPWESGQDPGGPSKAKMVARCRARFVVTAVGAG